MLLKQPDRILHVVRHGKTAVQVRDLEVDRVESICTPAAASMAAGVRDMLNESGRINAKKGGSGPLNCLLEVPAVRFPTGILVGRYSYCMPHTPLFVFTLIRVFYWHDLSVADFDVCVWQFISRNSVMQCRGRNSNQM